MKIEALTEIRDVLRIKIIPNLQLQVRCQELLSHIPIPDVSFLGAYDAGHSSLFDHMLVHPNVFPSVSSHTNHFSSATDDNNIGAKYRMNQLFYFAEKLKRKELMITDVSVIEILFKINKLLQSARRIQNKGLAPHLPLDGNIVSVDHDSSFENITPRILKKYNSKVLLVLVLRDPVERLLSHYNRVRGRLYKKNLPLEELIDIDFLRPFSLSGKINKRNEIYYRDAARTNFNNFIYRGMYVTQLKELLKIFRLEQFFIVSNIELRTNTTGILDRLFKRLSLPTFKLPKENFFTQPTPAIREPIAAETTEILTDFYRPYNEELFRIIGKELY